jgi:hypothetical protein
MDEASQALARNSPLDVRQSFRALANHSGIARTTLQHRARGRCQRKRWKTNISSPFHPNGCLLLFPLVDSIWKPEALRPSKSQPIVRAHRPIIVCHSGSIPDIRHQHT